MKEEQNSGLLEPKQVSPASSEKSDSQFGNELEGIDLTEASVEEIFEALFGK